MPALLLSLIAAFLLLGIVATPLARHRVGRPLVYGASGAVSAILFLAAGYHLITAAGPPPEVVLPLGLPSIGAHFRLDALAAAFLVVVNLGAAAASLFGLGDGSHEEAPERVLPFYPLFLGAMNLVVLAADAFTFLLAWESMSLTSWALVLAHHRTEGNVRAGYVYLMMAGFGTLMLLLALALLAGHAGTYDFAMMRVTAPSPLVAGVVLALVLLGAGSKAGLVPLHVWLPLAHPAAPSHVSALMSGVMTKVAVYGFVRIVFDLLGPPAWWWSMVVLGLGGITAVLGVLYALMQHDLKRLLAYHTVENIGIIFTGLGLALAFKANGMPAAAALALTGALFHVLNHMLFKSLLFFGAGAVLSATGERDMERLGGLIGAMPLTGFAFLAGSLAISALPPLNGFASEWLIFQAILLSPALPQWGLKLMVPAIGAMLALAAALAAACFVKAFGITFLGRGRSAAVGRAREADRYSLAAMLLLVALCVLCGVLPGLVIDALAAVAQPLVGSRMMAQAGIPWLSIVPIEESRSSYNGLLVFVFIAVSAWLSAIAVHRWASRTVRRGPAWDCGFPDPSPATEYTAASFAQPIRRVFGTLVFRAQESVDMPPPGDMRPARFEVSLRDLIWEVIYLPIANAVGAVATRLNFVQFLTIRRYLALVFMTLVVLLTALAVAP
jgi:formate hydrogenlyase subunit 3/multisubunit Na+/H+ antiporter MnhD subunit